MLENALEQVGRLRTREAFLARLSAIKGPRITLFNDIDDSSPKLNFRFIDAYVLGRGVTQASEDSMYGCDCKPDNGRHMGCEYTACGCLDQMNNPRFPYIATGDRAGTLRDAHLRTRDAIFECNRFCNCGDNCKNKLVQWGRKVPLEIFKTPNRGWGKAPLLTSQVIMVDPIQVCVAP
jgi:histone-lysine N-methyltransferase SUV39H